MTSPQKMDLMDYETMYKRHVHGNMILNDDLRLLDSMKKSKLKELNRDSAAFKKRFLPKSHSIKHGTLPDIHFCRHETPRPSPKPSFVVCKDSPCSLKNWNNLTDVSGTSIDVYKTEVLQTDEAPLSFRNKSKDDKCSLNADDRRQSSFDYLKLPKTPQASREAQFEADDNIDARETLRLPAFRERASSMPLHAQRPKVRKTEKFNLRPRADSDDTDLKGNRYENNTNVDKESTIISVTKAVQIEIKVISPIEEDKTTVPTIEDHERSSKLKCGIQRARSFTFSKPRDVDTDAFRSRSNTLDTVVGAKEHIRAYSGRLLKRRETINMADVQSHALRRMSLFDRLVSMKINSDDNLSKDFESLGSCRYLRIPGEDINGSREDVSLQNLQFSDENS